MDSGKDSEEGNGKRFCRRQHAKDTAKADGAGGGAKSYGGRRCEELLQEAAQKLLQKAARKATAEGGAKATVGSSTKSYGGRQRKKPRQKAARKAAAGGSTKSYGGESDAGGAIICQHCLSLLDSLIQQRLL